MLLDLGVPVDALYEGDPYFDIAKDSTALHVAAWKAWPKTVKLLIERGANVNAQDVKARTPLMLAVKACVDSYWTNRRSPESVEALLRAGASVNGVDFPCGYAEADALLQSKRLGN
jgi:ankyrin repeat protein